MARTRTTKQLIVIVTLTAAIAVLSAPIAQADPVLHMHDYLATFQQKQSQDVRDHAQIKQLTAASAVSPSTRPIHSAQYLRAQRLRGLALDRMYHVGPYARTNGNAFPWRNVEIGGVAAFAAIVAGLGAAVARRRRSTPLPA